MKLSQHCLVLTGHSRLFSHVSFGYIPLKLYGVCVCLCVNRNLSQHWTLTHQRPFIVLAYSRKRICVYITVDMADPFQYSLMFSLGPLLINACFAESGGISPLEFPV